jgi:hypothetical protein
MMPAHAAERRGNKPHRPVAYIERDMQKTQADYEAVKAAMTPEDWDEFGNGKF